jgi:hypothetical protein
MDPPDVPGLLPLLRAANLESPLDETVVMGARIEL